MLSKGLFVAVATASAAATPSISTATSATTSLVQNLRVGASGAGALLWSNRALAVSRSTNAIGTRYIADLYARTGSGSNHRSASSVSISDGAAIAKIYAKPFPADEFLASAALLFQAGETPLDRDIQEIVSNNYAAYWD